jgi:hypothetical protein
MTVRKIWMARRDICIFKIKIESTESSRCSLYCPEHVSGGFRGEWLRCHLGVTSIDPILRGEVSRRKLEVRETRGRWWTWRNTTGTVLAGC